MALPMHFWLKKVVPILTISNKLIRKPSLNKVATTVWRSGMHTAVMMPYMQAALLFGVGSLKDLSVDSGFKLMNERFVDGYSFALLFWPFVYLGLYTCVPARFGTLYMDSFRVVWASLASFVANKMPADEVPSWPWLIR